MKHRIRLFLTDYLLVILFFIAANIFLRGLEYLYVFIIKKEIIGIHLFIFGSIHMDMLFILFFSMALLPLSIAIALFNEKVARVFVRVVGYILIFIHLGLTQYFLTKNTLLTCVVFELPLSHTISVVTSEFSENRLKLIATSVLILVVVFYLLFFRIKKISISPKWAKFMIMCYLIIAAFALTFRRNKTFRSLNHFDTSYQFLLANSKMVYLIKDCLQHKNQQEYNLNELENEINFYQENSNFRFNNQKYPLTHNEPSENVLGNYFEQINKKPNIVIIIAESLSTTFSGSQNCIGGSLTPFLDSLTMHSLYWNNFFSNAEESYGVLPNILASLPSGTGYRGFRGQDVRYNNFKTFPNHISLIKMLNMNDYQTNAYYGGWGNFDNVGIFYKENNIGRFVSDKDFNTSKYKKPTGNNAMKVWGYDDCQLFDQSFDYMALYDTSKPFLNIYITLSFHSPYNLVDRKYHSKEFLDEKLMQLQIPRENVEKLSDEMLASIFFADDALKSFLYSFSKRPDFSNTIFIITGDHSVDLNLSQGIFENYHTPLIIYSPLLIKSAKFSGISSHIDILPSLAALLEETYKLNFPEEKHHIGQGLDTSSYFSYNRMVPLQIESIERPNFIIGNHVIYADNVMRIDSSLNVVEESDSTIIEWVKRRFDNYKYINNYVCTKNKIWYADDVEFLP